MTRKPEFKVSVVIPAFNAEKYLATAIESCLNQTEPPHEIIVVDDCSVDGTASVAASYAPRVRLTRLEVNSGVATARNRGIESATGNWIAFLDADDWFLPEKLERQRRCSEEHPDAVLIYTNHRLIALDKSEREGRFTAPERLWPALRFREPLKIGEL